MGLFSFPSGIDIKTAWFRTVAWIVPVSSLLFGGGGSRGGGVVDKQCAKRRPAHRNDERGDGFEEDAFSKGAGLLHYLSFPSFDEPA